MSIASVRVPGAVLEGATRSWRARLGVVRGIGCSPVEGADCTSSGRRTYPLGVVRNAVLALALAAAAGIACGAPSRPPTTTHARQDGRAGHSYVSSNVRRADYAGSAACAP